MRVYYKVSKKGYIDIDNQTWEQLKQDYQGDINRFAIVTVSEEISEFDEDAITITNIRE